jgi:queuine/archaeosine tRNA-ribosyltransferase
MPVFCVDVHLLQECTSFKAAGKESEKAAAASHAELTRAAEAHHPCLTFACLNSNRIDVHLQECTSFKAAAKESEKAAAAAHAELARAAEAHQAAVTAHGEEASRLRRIAKKKAEELEELQVGWVDVVSFAECVVVVFVRLLLR